MADYYIDPGWTGTPSGTVEAPFTSATQLPTRAAEDNVYFKAGTVHTGQLTHSPANATSTALSAPVTYGAYGEGPPPIIQSNDWCVDLTQPGAVIQDLQFRAINSFSWGGVRALNTGQVRVQRCVIESTCEYGIRFDNTTAGIFSTLEALYNTVLGTFGSQGLLVVFGSAIGGVFEDIRLNHNTISTTGVMASTGTSFPAGIRVLSRTTPVTASSGTVDLDLFMRGLECSHNVISNTGSFGLAISHVSSGGTETLKNRVLNNVLTDIGNGLFDTHGIWFGAVRDLQCGWNTVDGTTMYQGSRYGTGVGIFLDQAFFGNEFDGAKRVQIVGNIVRNTGRLAEGSSGELEVAGAGILAFLSQELEILDNQVIDCYNGIGVLGWYGTGLKSTDILIQGNEIRNPVRDGLTLLKGATDLVVKENFVAGYGEAGSYIETAGAYTVTYTETRNNIVGPEETTYQGGSEPTSTATPRAARTPAAGNLTLSSVPL